MKHVLLVTTMTLLVAAGACSRGEDNQVVAKTESGNAAAPVAPSEITAANAYEIRHERYEEMGDSLKAISRQLKGGSPDVATIQREAGKMASLATQVPTWFPAGSGPDVHPKSRAKADIWSNPDGFRRAHEAFLTEMQNFKRIADGGDIEQIRAAIGPLGKSCANCHDDFRGPER